ncbi:MAG: pyroglutamyl-peptidase I [Candidatus Rokubacteria bacterium]|nr:pyroglutamyl-peptidase I [Candidatus Rokubacteria bacterium]MBI3825686.1 pyroglutamyl-peptidase I [Candidatus Rokubacteria bacterium]
MLVTGFEPFGSHAVNPSEEVAKAVDARVVGDSVVRSVILPVDHARLAGELPALLEEHDPAAVLHLGLAEGRPRLSLERVAVNVMDSDLSDNTGRRAAGEPCVPGGPAGYFSTLPLGALLAALTAEGVPAAISHTAGTYLCNQAMYTTLHTQARRGRPTPAGFIHVPLTPSMVAQSGLEQPSMDAALMVRAIEIALPIIARPIVALPVVASPILAEESPVR